MDTLAAARAGDLEFTKWLHNNSDLYDIRCTSHTLDIACARGDLEMIQWLLANRSDIFKTDDFSLMNLQRKNPVLEPHEWSYRSHFDGYLYLPEPLPVSEGHLRVFRWLMTEYEWGTSKSYPDSDRWTTKIAMHAAACNNFEMIEIFNKYKFKH